MKDLKELMRQNYLEYASYVILDRAIPNIIDGLKPVQRRLLYTLWTMHDGKLHKVANAVGQTMALHPHGDGPITEALVNLANKGFLLDRQGNFGNLLTGDPAAAARYIETRLSSLAIETLFNPDLTEYSPSYDGRHQEPIFLPAKIPVLLLQGASGIAVGMSTHLLPHNFAEVLTAEIDILEGREATVLPDFSTGGIMDASQYNRGLGKIKLRAKVDERDPKTVVITEICYGTTTESLIQSIDEAAKKGRIKIDAINDYTAEKVEIEIKLPRGHYAEDLIKGLYVYTECEVTLNPQGIVISEATPKEMDVNTILELHAHQLKGYLKRELEIEKARLEQKIFEKSLERIFIENRVYKKIENLKSYEAIHKAVEQGLEPFHDQLLRIPTHEDREHLLALQIRRISLFDLEKSHKEIAELEGRLKKVETDLKDVKQFTIKYLNGLLTKYGDLFPRRTQIGAIDEVDKRAIAMRNVKVGVDLTKGFVGTKINGDYHLTCTPYDKLLAAFKDGTYQVINIAEKSYLHHDEKQLHWVGIADKQSIISVAYKDPKTHLCYAKRFKVVQFITEKTYRYFEENMTLEYFSLEEVPVVEVLFIPKLKQKLTKTIFSFGDISVKNVAARGIRISSRAVKRLKQK